MSKIVFFSFPLSGHVNPQIELCRKLSEKNINLIFFTSKEHFKKFDGIKNIELRKYPEKFQQYFDYIGRKRKIHHRMLTMLSTFYYDAELLIDFCIDELGKEKPNVVICDQFAIWGRAATRYYNIPLCKFFSSIMGDEIVNKSDPYLKNAVGYMILTQGIHMFRILSVIHKINKKYGKICEGINELMSPGNDFCMVMTSKRFHPGGELYANNVKFIGADHKKVLAPVKKNKIFISLGTISMRKDFFVNCVEATKHLGFEVIITLAGNKNHDISKLKKYTNVKVYDNLTFEEYREVVNSSALFISHGGFNGVTTALLYETPLIICPVSPEQINNAKLISKYKCGLGYYKKKINIDELKQMVDSIIDNHEIKKNLKMQSEALINSLGYEKVTDLLIKEFGLNKIKEE